MCVRVLRFHCSVQERVWHLLNMEQNQYPVGNPPRLFAKSKH